MLNLKNYVMQLILWMKNEIAIGIVINHILKIAL